MVKTVDDTTVRILHLSDLHFRFGEMVGKDWAVDAFNRDLVTSSMLEHIEGLKGAGPDLIIITGDLAYGGKREDYEIAGVFCDKLLKATGLGRDRLFIVPGNHDVNRAEVPSIHTKTIYAFEKQDEVSAILGDAGIFPIIMGKFSEFNQFTETAMGRQLFDESTYHFVDGLRLEKCGQEVLLNLVGLNSSLFAGYDKDDEKKLALSLRQVSRAVKQMSKRGVLSMAFFHHPFDCYHPCDEVSRNMLKDKLNLLFTGHLHEPGNAAIRDEVGRAAIISAGACYEKRESENSFDTVEIDLTTGEGRVQFYKYVPDRNRWTKNTDVNLDHEDGIFCFDVETIADNPLKVPEKKLVTKTGESRRQKMQKYFVHDYLLPEDFTGRREVLDRLGCIVKGEADPITKRVVSFVSVRGPGGMGKSCMLRKAVEEFNDGLRFGALIWFSFYEARTEDEGYFFREVVKRLKSHGLVDNGKVLEGAAEVRRLGELLRGYVEAYPVMLVLDGLEVIQHTESDRDPRFGNIVENYKEIYKLIAHVCNHQASTVFVSSRTKLAQFSGISGHLEIPLEILSDEEGAELLKKIGVKGNEKELEEISRLFAGHPLCLRAVGRYMADNLIEAGRVEELTGDTKVFERSTEGEKLTRIVNAYRDGLAEEQQYFLKMLSIHPRSVSEANFGVLVERYGEEGRDERWVNENIIAPLYKKELVERLEDSEGKVTFNAHPLMKLAFSTWVSKTEEQRSHELWAMASEKSPDRSSSIDNARTLDELQPYIDAVEHYFEARMLKEAWDIFQAKRLDRKIFELGYVRMITRISGIFEEGISKGKFKASGNELSGFFNKLATSHLFLDLPEKAIKYAEACYEASQGNDVNYTDTLAYGLLLARGYMGCGYIDKGMKLFEDMKRLKKKLGTGKADWFFFMCAGDVKYCAGKYRNALELYVKAIGKSNVQYNSCLTQLTIASIHIRSGRWKEGESAINKVIQIVKMSKIVVLEPDICAYQIMLSLKQGRVKEARSYDDKQIMLMKQMGGPCEDNDFLLVAEGRYDRAIRMAEKRISTDEKVKFNKAEEIESLIILSLGWNGKGDGERANDYLDRAEAFMNETGCWRDRDRFEEAVGLVRD